MKHFAPIPFPMGSADLEGFAEALGRQALAAADLSKAVTAYEDATGQQVVVTQKREDRPELSSHDMVLRERLHAAVGVTMTIPTSKAKPLSDLINESDAAFLTGLDKANGPDRTSFAVLGPNGYEPLVDPELTDALYPQPVPEAGTIEEAQAAGAQAIADLVEEPADKDLLPIAERMSQPAPNSIIKKNDIAPSAADNPPPVAIAEEDEPDAHMPEILRANPSAAVLAAMRHLNSSKVRYTPKWSRFEDAEMVRRILNGEPEKAIAAVMEFSLSHIRQRIQVVRDYQHGAGFTHSLLDLQEAFQRINGSRA